MSSKIIITILLVGSCYYIVQRVAKAIGRVGKIGKQNNVCGGCCTDSHIPEHIKKFKANSK